jgi:hypothetical protein
LLCYAYLHPQPHRILPQNTITKQTGMSDFGSLMVMQLKQQHEARNTAVSGSKQAFLSRLHAHETAIAHSAFFPSVPLKTDLLIVPGSDMGIETFRDERISTKRAGCLWRCAHCFDVERPHDLFISGVEVPR